MMKVAINALNMLLYCLSLYGCQSTEIKHRDQIPTTIDTVAPHASPHLVYYDYGRPPEPYFHKAQIEMLQRNGVGYSGFVCMITDSLSKAVPAHNHTVLAALQEKFPGFGEIQLLAEMQA